MAKEYPASKTQLAKATELGIDMTDQPGDTTLGARLEAAGWAKDGKSPLDGGPMVATVHLESRAAWAALTPKERRARARGQRADDAAYRQWQYGDNQREAGEHPNFELDTTPSASAPYEPSEG